MAVTLLNAPAKSREAIANRLKDGHMSTRAIANRRALSSAPGDIRGWAGSLCYPHVRIDLAGPNPDVDLMPYAWQHIHGTSDDPVSLEVTDDTDGDLRSVAVVSGLRLRQTVTAVLDIIRAYYDHSENYIIKVLHLRSMAFRAVILERPGDWSRSLAIPLAPVPGPVEAGKAVGLPALIETLRALAQAKITSEKTSRDIPEPNIEGHPSATAGELDSNTYLTMFQPQGDPMIQFKPLPYFSFDIVGTLAPVMISPLPDASGIINSNTIAVNATLPKLGTPPKLPPGGPHGPGGGQYIELLIDDDPVTARVTAALPYQLSLPDGTHLLQFIMSAGDGECIKDNGYVASAVVHINSKSAAGMSAAVPMIIYNLPRVSHRHDDVILDFALLNVAIDDPTPDLFRPIRDYQVRVWINGQWAADLDYWNAYRITGLDIGEEYVIRLALVSRATGTIPSQTNPREVFVRQGALS
jgi:hypothetical protein